MATNAVSTQQKRGMLRAFKEQAKTQYQASLYSALLSMLSAPTLSVQKGRILVTTSSGEVSASYSTNVGLNQAELLEVVSELVDGYEDAKAALVEDGTEEPNDDQIYQRQLADLRPVKGFTPNFMYLSK